MAKFELSQFVVTNNDKFLYYESKSMAVYFKSFMGHIN
jgi:hypothetical protein